MPEDYLLGLGGLRSAARETPAETVVLWRSSNNPPHEEPRSIPRLFLIPPVARASPVEIALPHRAV